MSPSGVSHWHVVGPTAPLSKAAAPHKHMPVPLGIITAYPHNAHTAKSLTHVCDKATGTKTGFLGSGTRLPSLLSPTAGHCISLPALQRMPPVAPGGWSAVAPPLSAVYCASM